MKKVAKKPTLGDLKKAGACRSGYRWYKENNRDVVKLAREYPWWYLWLAEKCHGDWVDLGMVDDCAEKWPGDALEFVADLLTPERFDACTKKNPWAALNHVAELLTLDQLDFCTKKSPWAALQFAPDLLTPERLDFYAELYPWAALLYAEDLITPERLEACKQIRTERTR